VTILEETSIESTKTNELRSIIGIEQHEQNLTCQFEANPLPTAIYWLNNGTTIVSRKYSIIVVQHDSEHVQ
jgi:hypothetical protein